MFEDFYLAFQDEQQATQVLYISMPEEIDSNGVVVKESYLKPIYQNIDILGVVYQPAPDPIPEDYEPVPYPAPNYGVNVRVVEGEDPSLIQQYSVSPQPFPQRVWAEQYEVIEPVVNDPIDPVVSDQLP